MVERKPHELTKNYMERISIEEFGARRRNGPYGGFLEPPAR